MAYPEKGASYVNESGLRRALGGRGEVAGEITKAPSEADWARRVRVDQAYDSAVSEPRGEVDRELSPGQYLPNKNSLGWNRGV